MEGENNIAESAITAERGIRVGRGREGGADSLFFPESRRADLLSDWEKITWRFCSFFALPSIFTLQEGSIQSKQKFQ